MAIRATAAIKSHFVVNYFLSKNLAYINIRLQHARQRTVRRRALRCDARSDVNVA